MKSIMKYLVASAAFLVIFPVILSGQSGSAADRLFDKYSGKEGMTSVYFSGKMLSMFRDKDASDDEAGRLVSSLKSIRILTVGDSALNKSINFHSELKQSRLFAQYEELMVVNENRNITKFLVLYSGSSISELLVISSGLNGNTLISIKGDLDLRSISALSKQMGMKELNDLEKLEQKKPGR